MTDEFDLEKFVELFDVAMTSDNPTVRKAFKNLLIVAALVDSETENKIPGPLRQLMADVGELKSRMITIERSKYNSTPSMYGPITTGYPSTNNPTWTVNNIPPITYTLGTSPNMSMATTLDSIYNGLNKNDNE